MARFSGKAELRQGDDFIKADKVAMEFGPDISKTGRAKATRRLVLLEAAGNVRIKQADIEAEADFVKRDADLGLFVLKGKPALAKQGDTRITGQEIVYNEISAQADVLGAGTLTMPVRTNLEGRALKKSETLKIKWAKGMVYRDRKNFAHFSEKVHAQVGQDSLSGDQLWVYFQVAPDAAKAGSAKDVASLVGRKRISRILSTGNVAARTVQTDPKTGRKNRDVAIACQSLAFLEAGQKAQIDGPGSLVILQQDPGQAGDANPWADVPANERPPKGFSRTKVTWKKSAAMSQMQQVGFFEDTVVAEHMGRGLAGPGAGQTPQRKSVIKSDRLWVTFKTAAGAAEGFQFSRLDAVGNAFFTSGTSKASGQSISYDDKQGSITITGGSGKFAQFVDEDEKKQQFTETVAKKIMFWPATQRAKFEGVDRITVTPR
jgi:lipopolysaccharide export system protein LptA